MNACKYMVYTRLKIFIINSRWYADNIKLLDMDMKAF